jgi:hypothetical protein
VIKRTLDLVYAAALTLGAAALLWASFDLQFAGTPISRDPTWFPNVLLSLILVTSVAFMMRALFWGSTTPVNPLRWRAFTITILVSSIYLFAFFVVGFIPATLVFIPLMSWLLGFHRPLVIALVTAGMTIGFWYAFTLLLNITPPGPGIPTFS